MSVSTTTLQVRLKRVDTFDLQVFKDKVAYDLADCQLMVAVKKVHELGAAEVFVKTIGSGITITDEETGKFRLVIGVAEKDAMSSAARYYWETVLVLSNGEPVTPDGLEGEVEVIDSMKAAS